MAWQLRRNVGAAKYYPAHKFELCEGERRLIIYKKLSKVNFFKE